MRHDLITRFRTRLTWRRATTVQQLATHTAAWLDGTLPFHAIPGTELDPETHDLASTLAAANLAGFLTTDSQPGHHPVVGHDAAVYEQRAAVTGFVADPRLLRHLQETGRANGLTVITHTVDSTVPDYLVVTRRDGQPAAAFGERITAAQLRATWHGISARAHRALTEAVQVTVIDPQWGRNDRMWHALAYVVSKTFGP